MNFFNKIFDTSFALKLPQPFFDEEQLKGAVGVHALPWFASVLASAPAGRFGGMATGPDLRFNKKGPKPLWIKRHAISIFEQRAQHPGRLLVHRHALRQQVGCGLVAGLVGQREQLACGAGHGLVA